MRIQPSKAITQLIWGAAIYDEGGDMQVESSKFTQNPGSHVICVNGTQPKQAKVLIRDCNVSNNPGVYGRTCGPCGAIACANSTTLIDHCTIKGNKALMTEPVLCGMNAGLYIVGSNVTLNDTLIERNEALYIAAMAIFDSKVKMNRCNIKGNQRSKHLLYQGGIEAATMRVSGSTVGLRSV